MTSESDEEDGLKQLNRHLVHVHKLDEWTWLGCQSGRRMDKKRDYKVISRLVEALETELGPCEILSFSDQSSSSSSLSSSSSALSSSSLKDQSVGVFSKPPIPSSIASRS